MQVATTAKTNLHSDAETAEADEVAYRNRGSGQIPLHPQGGSDLRLLVLFPAHAVHSLRRKSLECARADNQEM